MNDQPSGFHGEITRRIYEAQHREISADPETFQRIVGQYDGTTFGIDPDWFKGKTALDAGCGNIGAMIRKLHSLGVAQIIGCDIGEGWIGPLSANLADLECRVDLLHGDVLALPFEDESFDFVSVNGVLVQLETMDHVRRGFAEGARVTKPGGYYFTSYGPCGGVMQGVIMPALREHYRRDSEFRMLIDTIRPDTIHAVIDKVVEDARSYGGQSLDADFLKSLFGWDYCVFLRNFIQSPTCWTNECTPAGVESWYGEEGFGEVRRLETYCVRSDIRKFFAPLHYDREHWMSRILYGEGYVQYIGHKP